TRITILAAFAPAHRSKITAVALEDLDLVAIWILDKKESGNQGSAANEFLDGLRGNPAALHLVMRSFKVRNRNGEMPISIAMVVRLRAALVHGEFQFEIRLLIAQVDEREALEIETICNLQTKSRSVERDGPLIIKHPDHGVNHFGH